MSSLKGLSCSWLLGVLLLATSCVQGASMALTFDDAPMPSTDLFEREERLHVYIERLEAHGIQAAFFCIGKHLQDGGKGSVRCLAEHGHILANHSYDHLHSSRLTPAKIAHEILRTEVLLIEYPTMRRWFRFPYLDYGNQTAIGGSDDKREQLELKLDKLGYSDGYITINTFDWYLNSKLLQAIKEKSLVNYDRLKTVYLTLMGEWIDAFVAFWEKDLEMEVKHVLLMHANDINALYLTDLLAMLEAKGWNFISPDEAFSDELSPLGDLYFKKFRRTPTTPDCLTTAHIDAVIAQEMPFTPRLRQ